MSYSLLEIQELLRTSPADVAKSFARGNHGQAYQILGMDEHRVARGHVCARSTDDR